MAGGDQGDERERITDEVSKRIGWRQNWGLCGLQDELRGNLLTAWVAPGIKVT